MKDNKTGSSPAMQALSDEALDNVTGGAVALALAADEESDPTDITADTPANTPTNTAVGSLASLTDSALKKIWVPSVDTGDSDSSAMF